MDLIINDKKHTVEADPAMPLLWVVRDLVGLKGTKFGCGMAQCGACTMLIDGQFVRSCVTPVVAAVSKKITTVEGLASNHPLKKAWAKYNVPQCGYCQPGQLMRAAALLNEKKKPSPKEVDQAMAGNICRCGTYPRIKLAILEATAGGSK